MKAYDQIIREILVSWAYHRDYKKRPPLSQLFHVSVWKSMANLLTKFHTRFTTPSDIMENAFFAALWCAPRVLASPSSSFSVCRSSNSPDTWMKKEHPVKEFSGPIPSVKHEFYHAQLISVSSRKRGKSRTKKIKNITHHTTDLDWLLLWRSNWAGDQIYYAMVC